MTTTTGDPSTLKTPASLSGGDLVSRLLAATPPYLYNVPLTPHSFFFSEMLRSFVQAKAEASSTGGGGGGGGGGVGGGTPNAPRRRKRSWRDARDRPLELTTKERPHHHHHHHHYHQHSDKYYHSVAQQQQSSPQVPPEIRLENDGKRPDAYLDTMETKAAGATFDQKPNFGGDILKPIDENKSEFSRQHGKSFFDERPRHFEQAQPPENVFPGGEPRKIKPEDSQQLDRSTGRSCNFDNGRSYSEDRSKSIVPGGQEVSSASLQLSDQKKLDFSRAAAAAAAAAGGGGGGGGGGGPFLSGMPAGRGCENVLQGVKGFALPSGMSGPAEFLPGPLWYPPYPMPQSYPGIDPLHFFIDLRVSGHIWDRKHASERQLSFKSKHCSAFSVPQSKECGNRPLNLTRDEATTTSKNSPDAENTQGTNYILKHLVKTYQDIQQMKTSGTDASIENEDHSKETTQQTGEDTTKVEDPDSSTVTNSEEERKDLRALIGLELVVDYVKEPTKDDSSTEQTSAQITE
ncbi:PREDICTED: uncharacterized protein LOC108774011 [Cyphomyrmex costatus]|uniref:Uncharacterized protein n=1 Tax=Cyphomyrmex costatus TaxID=456900 RepID=A0A195CQI4_9HYME|nr:PREDICTED: uncharacterized protein LOC108774011 [Cyphomyrmex costatus]KYN02737.1 hypothetical protein ALC62_06537 [Cyphomyrmex costatus]